MVKKEDDEKKEAQSRRNEEDSGLLHQSLGATSVGSDIGGAVLKAASQAGLLDMLLKLVIGWFTKSPKPVAPQKPVEPNKPTPAGGDDDFPDDHIPRPTAGRKVAKVTLHLARAQYSRERFPQEYNANNPFGLVSQGELKEIERGNGALTWLSKFWLDLTAYDEQGHEFVRADVLTLGLAYKTEIRCGDAFIIGRGADAEGQPVAGYETNDTDQIGNGITAWLSSKGFLHQMQCFAAADGETFHCSGSVNGVRSNEFDIKVS